MKVIGEKEKMIVGKKQFSECKKEYKLSVIAFFTRPSGLGCGQGTCNGK